MDTHTTNDDRGISEEEELVETWNDDSPNDTNDPCAESVDRDGRVVSIRDGRPNLRVGRIVL